MAEHIEHWLSEGYGKDQILRAAERMESVQTLMELEITDVDKSLIGGEPLIRRYGR
jgi:hypothetical protein